MQSHSLNKAVQQLSGANLALIALPGTVVREAAFKALNQGLNLLIFSNDVSLEDEIAIKAEGRRRELLVMGPGCGTAIIDGVGLGCANRVRRGPIGLIGTSGTGIQEVSTLIHRLGSGVSHAIGTGSNDLSVEVGGSTMLDGIDRLEQDSATEVIVLLSTPPAPLVARSVLARARDCYKPLVIYFLGSNVQGVDEHMAFVRTFHEAATTAVDLVAVDAGNPDEESDDESAVSLPPSPAQRIATTERYARGIFSSGTLAGEAVSMLRRRLGSVATNISASGATRVVDARHSHGHTVVDMSDTAFGRVHPIREPSLRRERFLQEAQDPHTAVLLFDLILGFGAPPDPATFFAQLAQDARAAAMGRQIAIIAAVCGTDDDPQPRASQVATLEAAGVLVAPSNAAAAEWAARAI